MIHYEFSTEVLTIMKGNEKNKKQKTNTLATGETNYEGKVIQITGCLKIVISLVFYGT